MATEAMSKYLFIELLSDMALSPQNASHRRRNVRAIKSELAKPKTCSGFGHLHVALGLDITTKSQKGAEHAGTWHSKCGHPARVPGINEKMQTISKYILTPKVARSPKTSHELSAR
jgi:hypothetical protein